MTSYHVAGTRQIRMGHKDPHWPHRRQPLLQRLLKWSRSLMRWKPIPKTKMQDQRRWRLNHILRLVGSQMRLWLSHTGHRVSRKQRQWQHRSQG